MSTAHWRRPASWNPERNWAYKPFNRKWRRRAPMFWLMPLELAGTVALLALFAIAQPDLFRTQLWDIGYVWGFNSSPDIILWAKANHQPAPKVPFVWSLDLTNYNVGISVLSLFVLFVKLVAFIMRVWTPILAVFFSFSMAVMYTVSVYGQMGPDYYDPAHPSPMAWYIRYGCWPAVNFPNDAVGSCRMAVGTYACTVYMLFIYLVLLGLAVYNMIPTAAEKEEIRERKAMKSMKRKGTSSGDDDDYSDNGGQPVEKVVFEMMPPSKARVLQQQQQQQGGGGGILMTPPPPQQQQQQYEPSPFTPRTEAYHSLERKLPFRRE